MTGYLLAPLFGGDGDTDVIRSAVAVGRRLGSHVQALHVRFDPQALAGITAPGMSAAMYEQMFEQAKHDAQQRAQQARDIFDQETANVPRAERPPPAAFSVGWTELQGESPLVIAEHARLANLVILGRPRDHSDVHAALAVESVLFDAARPVVVIPPGASADWGQKILVAWNGSAQSARAMFDALPFLKAAKEVVVVSMSEAASSTAGAAVAALGWQGVAATPVSTDVEQSAIASRLFAQAAGRGCDLVVMGGYGHSRMREFILGGATRHALHEAELPFLMSH